MLSRAPIGFLRREQGAPLPPFPCRAIQRSAQCPPQTRPSCGAQSAPARARGWLPDGESSAS
eukprot:12466787-Alexandrium_andersonii.AAC.1